MLEAEIRVQDRTLKQLRREGRVAIYELSARGGILYGYEVICIKILPAKYILGRDYPEREAYPSSAKSSNDWGKIAWSYPKNGFEAALKQFKGLVEEEQKYGFNVEGLTTVLGLEESEGKDSGLAA